MVLRKLRVPVLSCPKIPHTSLIAWRLIAMFKKPHHLSKSDACSLHLPTLFLSRSISAFSHLCLLLPSVFPTKTRSKFPIFPAHRKSHNYFLDVCSILHCKFVYLCIYNLFHTLLSSWHTYGSMECTAELHLSRLIGMASHPEMHKIWIIGLFFENRLHSQFEFRLLLLTVCICI